MILNPITAIKKKSATNITQTFCPLLWYNRILGLAIFEVPSGRLWLKLTICYVLVRSMVYGFILWYGNSFVYENHDAISIKTSVFQVILIVNVIIAIISTILALMNYKKIKLADETLENFGIDPEYTLELKENLQTLYVWCFGGLLIFSCDFAIAHYVYDDPYDSFIKTIVFEYPSLLNSTVELNFAVQISTLGKRFERLNTLIQSIIVTTSSTQPLNVKHFNKYENILKNSESKIAVKPNYYYKNRSNIELILRTARQLHLDLCATSREVNATCSKQMLLQMASMFLLLTGFSYCFYLVYNDPRLPLTNKIQPYISLGIWIIFSIVRLIYVVRTSVNVITEAQKTSQMAHEIQVPRTQFKLIDEIHQLSLQIMQHPLTFTASGLVVLDFGYVQGFVGSVTTYVMILIQNQPDMMKAASTLTSISSDNSSEITPVSIVQ